MEPDNLWLRVSISMAGERHSVAERHFHVAGLDGKLGRVWEGKGITKYRYTVPIFTKYQSPKHVGESIDSRSRLRFNA